MTRSDPITSVGEPGSTNDGRRSLSQLTVSGGVVTALSQGTRLVTTLLSTVVLARLLSADDFGLVGLVFSVISFLRVFKDAGLSSATIQRQGISHAQVSNLFWINTGVSAALGLVLVVLGPVLARFYGDNRLVGVSVALSLLFILGGTTVQHQALLRRDMRFGTLAWIETASAVVSLVVGVAAAMAGWAYWALVASTLANEGALLLLTWVASGWRPQRPMRLVGTKPLLSFGASMTAGSILFVASRNVDTLLIGRFYGPHGVGIYTRALLLLMRPIEQLFTPVAAVFVPALSRLQSEPERYRRAFLQFFETVTLLTLPAAGIGFALAQPLTHVVLGPGWDETARILAGFTPAAVYLPLASPSGWLLVSQGRGRDYVVANAAIASLTIAAFVAGLPFGPLGVAMAYSAASILVIMPILFYLCGRQGPVTTADLWRAVLRHAPLWAVSYVATAGVSVTLNDPASIGTVFAATLSGFVVTGLTVATVRHDRQLMSRLACMLFDFGKNAARAFSGRHGKGEASA